MKKGPKARYDALVKKGAIAPDPAQTDAIARLDALSRAVARYERKRKGWFSNPSPPNGLYLWGGVGRGKTMVMDIFFNHTGVASKRRAHFHDFMADAHARVAHWRGLRERERRRHPAFDRNAPDDPIGPVAHDLAASGRLLCFDELQVSDIADAMILSRLFDALFARGVVMVSTSNRHPDDLYKDGLNRQLFTPFIDRLKTKVDVFELRAAKDYRLEALTERKVYHHPLGPEADAAMNAAWDALTAGGRARETELTVARRRLPVPCATRGAARFTFADLCEAPLGAADYAAIAGHFGAVFLDRIPKMDASMRNEARRFVTLIDILYEARVKFVCSADAPPDALYADGDGAFEFERAASRLFEMGSRDYLAQAWRGAAPQGDDAS